MTTPQTPMVNAGLLYVNNLQLTAGAVDAGTGLFVTTMGIAAGQARDSTDINDITLSAAVVLNTATTAIGRVNGLDQGTGLTANAQYAVYAIGDSTGYEPSGSLMSLSFTQPLLPPGYDMFRRIGSVKANAAATGILNFVQRGNGSRRDTYYAVALATTAIVIANTAFQPIVLTTQIPTTSESVHIASAMTSDAGATRTLLYSANASTTVAQGATGNVVQSSPASTVTTTSLTVPIDSTAGVNSIQIAASNAAVTAVVTVQGFVDLL